MELVVPAVIYNEQIGSEEIFTIGSYIVQSNLTQLICHLVFRLIEELYTEAEILRSGNN